MFCRNKFEAALKIKGASMTELADYLKLNRATLYKKVAQQSDFTRAEIQSIKTFLNLSAEEVMDIFYAQ